MSIRLNGATSGSIEIDVPAVAGTDTAITIPATSGGEFIVSDSAGDVNIDSGTLYVDASTDRVGIGTTSVDELLHIEDSVANYGPALKIANPNVNRWGGKIDFESASGATLYTAATIKADGGSSSTSGNLIFETAGTEAARIDGSGRLLVGASTASSNAPTVQAQGPTTGDSSGRLIISRGSSGVGTSTGTYWGSINFENNGSLIAGRISCEVDAGVSSGESPGRLVFSTTADGASSPTTRLTIKSDGLHVEPAIYNATGAGSTVVVNSSGEVLRTSSSLKYKTDVEDLQNEYADAILNVRPVWYRSTSKYDKPEWGWWGFIAEEVAEIDPRLVGWKTTEVVYDDEGQMSTVELDEPVAEDVYYDRFVPHLLNLIKRQQQAIETLEAKVAALETQNASFEARLAALEGGTTE